MDDGAVQGGSDAGVGLSSDHDQPAHLKVGEDVLDLVSSNESK